MSLHFDLVDLRLMVRVAEFNSVTRGADATAISVPAASTRIKNIEEGLGAKLLYRTSQGVTLTPPGQAFVHHARQVLAQLEHLRGDLQEYVKGIKGHLRVFANTTALSEFLAPVLRTYLLSHPDVNVDLRERPSQDIVRAVTDGHTDIGIVAGNVRTEALQTIKYRRDRLVLVVAAEHPLSTRKAVAFEETLEEDYVGLAESTAIHTFLRERCDEVHRPFRMRIQVGGFESACRMVEASVGVAVMPESAARRHARTMGIHIVPLSDKWSLREMIICVRDRDALPPFARDLLNLLVQDAADAQGGASS